MTPAELARLHERAAPSRGWSSKSYADLLDQTGVLAQVTETGFVLARRVGDEAEILMVAVDPEAQRGGVATRLLSTTLQTLATHGVTSVFLEVEDGNQPAIALYNKFGFAQTGRRKGYYRHSDGRRVDALVLSKTL